MNPFIQFKTTVPNNLILQSPSRRSLLLIPLTLALVCFALSPAARAACQEGCFDFSNTHLGEDALVSLTTTAGQGNTAVGSHALSLATFSHGNTAIGASALAETDNSVGNTAIGVGALGHNTTGGGNTATGASALVFNTDGEFNTAMGSRVLLNNTTGDNNTATGFQALFNNHTGANNIALGVEAGFNLTTGDNNIDIGHKGVAGESNTIRIGTVKLGGIAGRGKALPTVLTRTFIAGISRVPVTGSAVHVTSSGQLGVAPSSERFKAEIKPMDKASEAIHALKPVTFRYKEDLDPEGIPQVGLVAEEVEKVNPDLVARGVDGQPYTVRYEAVNAMLLNEFLKEHRKNEEQEATITRLQKQIEALTAGLQKVSAQLEVSRPTPQVVNNP
jgi:Chaperone of endosialidase